MCHGWRVRVVGVFHGGADELLDMASRAACGLQNKSDKVDARVPFKLDLLGSLGHAIGPGTGCGTEAGAGRGWSDCGDIYERGGAVLIKHEVHAGVLNLLAHNSERPKMNYSM